MHTGKAYDSDTQLGLLDKEDLERVLFRKMPNFFSSCLLFFCNSILLLFKFITLHVFRISSSRDDDHSSFLGFQKEKRDDSNLSFSFKFQHRKSEENNIWKEEQGVVAYKETPAAAMVENKKPSKTIADIKNYHFLSKKGFSGFIEEPEAMTFQVNESFLGLQEHVFLVEEMDAGFLLEEELKNTDMDSRLEEESKIDDNQVLSPMKKTETEESNSVLSEMSSIGEREVRFISEEFSGFDSDTESSSDGYSVKDLIVGPDFSDCDYFGDSDHNPVHRKTSSSSSIKQAQWKREFFLGRTEKLDDEGGEFQELKEEKLFSSAPVQNNNENHFTEAVLNRDCEEKFEEDSLTKDLSSSTNFSKVEEGKNSSKETFTQDFDVNDELDEIWEHQDLIEQLRLELKKVRAIGLPTIFEETESPKSVEDLKTSKIDEPTDELDKFYRWYIEKMRKLDVLNYQKMHAMGLFQLKDHLESMRTKRPLFSTTMSHLSHNLLPFCLKKSKNDPWRKFIKDLQCDRERVYVGQICLSWEFLRWQYERFHHLTNSEPFTIHQYNHVAGEFQQFQVILHRFVENEPFQGPRLLNYIKQRCVLRNLLQVPVIKEDCLKDKMEKCKAYYDIITKETLEEIMEETIRVFWEFVKAERHETPRFLKGFLVQNFGELRNPSECNFMADIQANLQKKEKKLKELLRTGKCIVKKLKKPQEDRPENQLLFSQIDLKLVSRVLKMPRITSDQLIWCQKKLGKITFSGRKVQREASFLLFPC